MAPANSSDLLDVFQRLQSLLLATSGIEPFLQHLAGLATTAADQSMSCGITARRDGQALTVASSDDRATALDETQYDLGEGPCLHALATGDPVLLDDLNHDTRWPTYLARARRLGLQCSLSLPLTADSGPVAALNLYGFGEPSMFTPPVRHRCELFAAQASGALQLTLDRAADRELRDQLEQALVSRTIIDQAIGILIGQQHCTADHAFDLLRRRSQSSQRKLRDVAADLIVRVTGHPPRPGKSFDHS